MGDHSEAGDSGGDRQDDTKSFRHSCRTKYIASVNKKLNVEQRCVLDKTPFRWLTKLEGCLRISRRLLRSLMTLWVERRGGFLISQEVVDFNLLDVCLGLGLRVDGQLIDLDEVCVGSECKKYFGNKTVVVDMIYEFLQTSNEKLCVDDFCRLYILLGISEFLIPNRSGRVFPILFTLVDDLYNLGNYNWGGLVYEYLVGSICSASMLLMERGNTTHLHVAGCVYLLQLWSFDHFLIPKSKFGESITKFPRILHWMDMKVSEGKIIRALKTNKVVNDVGVSKFELSQPFVKEAFDKYSTGFDAEDNDDDELEVAVQKQTEDIFELQRSVAELKCKIAERRYQQAKVVELNECGSGQDQHSIQFQEHGYFECGGSTPMQDAPPSDVVDEDNVQSEKSTLYHRLKDQPRTRLKSQAIRTPFVTYARKKRQS